MEQEQPWDNSKQLSWKKIYSPPEDAETFLETNPHLLIHKVKSTPKVDTITVTSGEVVSKGNSSS